MRRVGHWSEAASAMQRLVRGQAEAWNRQMNPLRATGPSTDLAAGRTEPGAASPLPRGFDSGPVSLRAGATAPKPRFLSLTFTNQAGSRPYKLYIPSGYRPEQAVPLVVMLHGCTQSPDDFAAGTRMNEAAEQQTFLVAYPAQTRSANIQKCWNWFKESQQKRNMGEPSLIAGITLDIMHSYAIDPRRVYVAGISAGGAAAAIMGDAYPELYAAIGVHSGLACGAANNLSSAMAAMRGGNGSALLTIARGQDADHRVVPAIVFHGDRDTTVHPRNAHAVVVQTARSAELETQTDHVAGEGGHDYSRVTGRDASGNSVFEHWMVHGSGHAWSGGSPNGSYTDPRGPDATAEMLRFFSEHPLPAAAGHT